VPGFEWTFGIRIARVAFPRTVDVHIRRLRAKLGTEYEQLIGTVRGVGYKLDPAAPTADG
jgi:DNA-binding response OmpR family regulator